MPARLPKPNLPKRRPLAKPKPKPKVKRDKPSNATIALRVWEYLRDHGGEASIAELVKHRDSDGGRLIRDGEQMSRIHWQTGRAYFTFSMKHGERFVALK